MSRDLSSDGRKADQGSWFNSTIEDVAEAVSTGPFGSLLHKSDYVEGGVPVINPINLVDGRISPNASVTVSEETVERLSAYRVRVGDILVARRGDIGRCALVTIPSEGWLCGTGCFFIRPSCNIEPRFLSLLLGSPEYREKLESYATGTTMLNLSNSTLSNLAIRIPQRDEQKRIVAVLDQAFAALDRARAHAEANLADARELFDNARRELLSANDGGITTSLGDEIELLVGFAFKSSGYVDAGDSIRLLRGDNIIQGSIRWDDAKHWPADVAAEYDRFSLREADVVLAMDRPWVKAGLKRALLQAVDVPALLVQRTACLRAGARLDNRYLFQLISGTEFSRHLLDVQTGIGVPHISGQQIKDFTFTLPPVAEQCSIVDKLDKLHTETLQLQSLYTRNLADLANLRQSLLQKAFSGNLT